MSFSNCEHVSTTTRVRRRSRPKHSRFFSDPWIYTLPMDPTMSEVAPPRTNKAPTPRTNKAAAPAELPPQRPVENLMARLTFPEDSDVESETRPSSRPPEQAETTNAEYTKIMARLDGLESLLEKHISSEVSAKASICENMEKYAGTVALNNALLNTSIEVMKSIQADVNRITWHQFEAAVKPERTTDIDKKSGAGQSGAGQSGAGQSGGYGCVVSKEPTPGHDMMRIELNEFLALQEDDNLKHVWVYIDNSSEKAQKVRVKSLTAIDAYNIISRGGCLFPYLKSCDDINRLYDFRIKFLVGQHYTHCRPKN